MSTRKNNKNRAAAAATKKKSGSGKWTASPTAEANRLSPLEDDWKLPGGVIERRTRGKKNELPRALLGGRLSAQDLFASTSEDSSDEEEAPAAPPPAATKKTKPDNHRIILEVDSLQDVVNRHLKPCSACGSDLTLEVVTCCLASRVKIKCINPKCCYIDCGKSPAAAAVASLPGSGSPLIERTTDYAINVLYILGFIASGDGGREAERLLGFLGLPNATTMDRRSFSTIEKRIAPVLVQLLEEILQENLEKEVRLVMEKAAPFDQIKFDNWKEAVNTNNTNGDLLPADYPILNAATDMGWQGRKQSSSGHAFMVGHETRKVVAWALYSKRCGVCQRAKGRAVAVPPHDCSKNYVGSSKAMEARAVLEMYVALYRSKQVKLGLIVSDDDTTMRSKLKWNNHDHMINFNTTITPTVTSKNGILRTRPDKGCIPVDMPQPLFGADPNHRTKLVGKQVYGLAKRKKEDNFTMTEMDAYRIKHNYGYMVRSIPDLEEAQYCKAATAVVDHHFGKHDDCGTWCRQKDLTAAERVASGKFYRCMTKDEDLYKTIRTCIDTYCTFEAMKEVAHGHDTQVNESLNNTISWHAPKNKVYSSSVSLRNRLAMAVGISSIGTLEYFTRLFGKLGIVVEADTLHFLEQRDNNRAAKITKATTKEFKKQRLKVKHEKLKENTRIAIKERRNREGTYGTGIGMEGGGYTEEDFAADTIVVCTRCKKVGHKTANSKDCDYYKPRTKKRKAGALAASTAADRVQRDADEADALDGLPFDTPMPNDGDSNSSGSADFYDAKFELSEDSNSAEDTNEERGLI